MEKLSQVTLIKKKNSHSLGHQSLELNLVRPEYTAKKQFGILTWSSNPYGVFLSQRWWCRSGHSDRLINSWSCRSCHSDRLITKVEASIWTLKSSNHTVEVSIWPLRLSNHQLELSILPPRSSNEVTILGARKRILIARFKTDAPDLVRERKDACMGNALFY